VGNDCTVLLVEILLHPREDRELDLDHDHVNNQHLNHECDDKTDSPEVRLLRSHPIIMGLMQPYPAATTSMTKMQNAHRIVATRIPINLTHLDPLKHPRMIFMKIVVIRVESTDKTMLWISVRVWEKIAPIPTTIRIF
jgi:hypothetical protein